MMYGDSAGWRIPSEAAPSLKKYIQSLYDHTLQGINHCHDPYPHSKALKCTGIAVHLIPCKSVETSAEL